MKQKHCLYILFTLFLTFTLMTGILAADEQNSIASVTLNKSATELEFEIRLTKEYVKEHKSSTLYLFEFLPYQSTSQINELEPVKEFRANEKITTRLDYLNGNVSRLYSKFVVAEQLADGSYNIITSAKYIENIGNLAENDEPYPETSSKKGLQVQLFADAQQLGVRHTVINLPINEYMIGESSEESLSFLYNGQTFYHDKNRIAALDHRVKTYSEAGINVYFNVILTAPEENTHEKIRAFYFENISPDATLYALNTRNETAMRGFQAFMDYICARYTRADHEFGFVPNLILGFEVNSGRIWNNAGSYEMASYVYSYVTAFRMAYIAMTSHYSEGRVYISLGSNFTSATGELQTAADAMLDYPSKDFLTVFNDAIKNSGDIPWGLSINPYASDPALTEYWLDSYAEENFETPYITMKNINTLTRYMAQEEYLYDGSVRSIIIGEFGISGDPADEASLTKQAAAYALAYYTAAQNDDIDAFIYHRHVDHSGENQYYGLWTTLAGTTVEPSAKKPIYNVFSLIDTARSEEVTSFVKQTVGSGAFGLFMKDEVEYEDFSERTVIEAIRAQASDYEKGFDDKVLFDLTGGKLCNFYPSDSVDYVELRPLDDASKTMLYARITGTPTDFRGISNTFTETDVLEDAQFITLRMMAAAPEGASSVSMMLRLQSGGDALTDTVIYEGEVALTPNEWQDVSFKIKDFSALTEGNLDLMKLWIRTSDSAPLSGEYGIWLESVTLHTKGGMGFVGGLFTVLLVLVLLAAAAYGVLWLRARYIRAKRAKQRRLAEERKRREQLRMQAMQKARGMAPPPYSPNQSNGSATQQFNLINDDDFR